MNKTNGTMSMIAGCVMLFGAACVSAQDWPQWRGPNRDNNVAGFAAPKTWPKELTQKWKASVGIGESSPVLVGDRIYVFSRQGTDEITLCLDAASGTEVWKDHYPAEAVKAPASQHPGTRSTPAVAEGKICTLGVAGVISCLDTANGKVVWRKDTKAKPQFYTSSSPMILDGKCIVYTDALTAYDLASGESKWTWKGGGIPYGSPVLMTVSGAKMIVTPSGTSLAGIGLADGKLLWQVPIAGGPKEYQNNFSTPIVDGQTVIYSINPKGKSKDSGTMAFKIEKKGDSFTATDAWKNPIAAHQYHTPTLKDGLLFGVSSSQHLFCLDAKTGDKLWEDSAERGKCGCILDAGPVMISLTSDKDLVAFRPSKKEYAELARYRVSDAETWAVPIVAGNRIYVKDKGGSLTLWTID
jgi:outer membrane protein assembly factor BamB